MRFKEALFSSLFLFKFLLCGNNPLVKEVNMKKRSIIFSLTFMFCALIFLTACENSTQLNCATINEITSAGSENYAVRISFQEDKRIKDKGVDVQIKFSEIGNVKFWEEYGEKLDFNIEEKDRWYSLTSLIVQAKDRANSEKFVVFSEAQTKTYLFSSEKAVNITMRVIVGDIKQNSLKMGEILVGSEPISSEYTLKIK